MTEQKPRVKLETSAGDIVIELEAEKVPTTVNNFLDYVNSGFYNNTIFHRVIKGFMIQGGGFDTDFQQKDTNEPIANEADKGIKNNKGVIAMARTMDPDSATAQFFINVADNDFLNFTGKNMEGWGYCAFGQVVEGMDIVNKISATATGQRAGHQDVPTSNIVIKTAALVEETVAS